MAEIVKMPKLSDTMTEGVVAKWHKKVGDVVNEGDLLAEIETDKATMEFESFLDGTLLYIGVPEGGNSPVDAILAILGDNGEDYSSLLNEEEQIEKIEEKVTPKKEEEPNTISIDISTINAVVVKMPKLSDTMTEGVVAKWHKNVGDTVKEGDLIADIETDKATMEFESFEDGTLLHIGIEAGGSAPVDAVLAIIGEKGADIDTLLNATKELKPVHVESKPEIKEVVEEQKIEKTTPNLPSVSPQLPVKKTSNGRIMASPLAKKLAEEKNINLEMVNGTGDGGRIIKRDIENFKEIGVPQNFIV
jgi:pyruvate dehydrogenase E2 component (dihydrolipoamide acetyltransferase)